MKLKLVWRSSINLKPTPIRAAHGCDQLMGEAPHPGSLPEDSPEGCSFLLMEPGRLVVPEPGAEWARAEGCGVWQAGSHCGQRRAGGRGLLPWVCPRPRFPSPAT